MSGSTVMLLIFLILFLCLALMVVGIVLIVRAIASRGEARRLGREEEERLRRLLEALQKMEARVENLEAILAQREPYHEKERLP